MAHIWHSIVLKKMISWYEFMFARNSSLSDDY
jgi:hypothetical protein